MKKKFFIALSITATILLVVFIGIKCVKYMYVCDILYSKNIVFEDVNNTDLKDFWTEVGIDTHSINSVDKIRFSPGPLDPFYYVYFSVDKDESDRFISKLLQTYSISDLRSASNYVGTTVLHENEYTSVYKSADDDGPIFILGSTSEQSTVNYLVTKDGYSPTLYDYCYDRVAKTILWGI